MLHRIVDKFNRGLRQTLGRQGEDTALRYLQQQGLRCLERNYRCRGGEIDLVMQEGATRVFVEVRYRSRSDYGSAADSITPPKRRRLILAARHYLLHQPDVACRFDVVTLDGERIGWIKDAFSADE